MGGKLELADRSLLREELRSRDVSVDIVADDDAGDQDSDGQATKQKKFRQLWGIVRPEMRMFSLACFALAVSSITAMAVPALMGRIVDTAANAQSQESGRRTLAFNILLLVIVSVVASLFRGLKDALFSITGERVSARLRNRLFSSLLSQEMAFFDAVRTGELVNRLSSDCTKLQAAVTTNAGGLLRGVMNASVATTILFTISWKLTLVMLSVVPAVVFVAVKYGRFVKKLSKTVQAALADATSSAQEALVSVRTVRSFAREDTEEFRYAQRVDHSFQLAKKRAVAYGLFSATMFILSNAAVAAVLWFGGLQVLDGSMSVGSLFSFILYTVNVGVALGTLSSVFNELMKALGSTERVFQLLLRTPGMSDEGTLTSVEGGHLSASRNSSPAPAVSVRFVNVHFTYPCRPERPILRGFSLDLQPGSTTALVGPSGHGKSTCAAMLMRFYDPDVGEVLLQGKGLPEYSLSWLRTHVASVMQEPVLFGASIKENLLYGCHNRLGGEPNDEDIWSALKQACVSQFVEGLDQRLDTYVGERGVRLSGGQKQRIAIARALLSNPLILVLDEATSALDAESEAKVQEALLHVMHGRTTLVIAHRLSTVKQCDNVAVVQDGRVVEQGTHTELLLREDGSYSKLVRRQLSGQGDGDSAGERV